MSIEIHFLEKCLAISEPCCPEFAAESWFSVRFVAGVLGFEPDTLSRKLTAAGIPRHPMQPKLIRFSDCRACLEPKE